MSDAAPPSTVEQRASTTEQPASTGEPRPRTGESPGEDLQHGFREPQEWLPLPDVADRWAVPVSTVRQRVRDGHLVAVRREGVLRVPAELVADDGPVKGLPGLLTVLADAGYSEEEAYRWVFTADPTLPGTPARALAENRGREVKRRAQALAF